MDQLSSLSAEIETLSHVLSLVEAFRAFDSDNDGSIDAQELRGLLGSLGYNPSEEDINTMMQEANTNRDGLLSISEFLEMNTKDLGLGGLKDILKRVFEELEFQGEDLVTGEDLYEVVGNIGTDLSQDECHEIIASMDGDGDGVISFEDFKLIVNSLD
ncbi:probable calcium-binding protein CML29 [Olea europaea var. sylvestris]|uniref:Probable calcium-binding CML29 n=1 Tax=Olea europaea subsp. europaea TaxID=158383 RepID=A0A8S0S442_OLEEU|nr:probable calcium-binding protein CML29 [Olea europaea var. sylvestris]CAA2986496.1 probable calcium-binding CML29 [Olea europaea subsp. europaea]